MSEFDATSLAKQAVQLGLVTAQQAKEARLEAEDGTAESLIRALQRRDLLTRWQADRLLKGDTAGYFIGGAKILFHIAEGSFARVYRGVKMPGGQTVAIKIMRNRFSSDPAAVERFYHESEAGQRLIHPNIVRTYEHGEDEGRHYILMEFVEGSNLRDFLRGRGNVSETDALPMLIGLAKGLQYSLEHGVTHRDLKATNILIGSNGVAKLVDFGLATVEGESRSGSGQNQRTVDYSALERTCNSPKGDPRSDIFFLGCVFYQMLTGSTPIPEVETSDPLTKMLRRGINSIKPISEARNAPSRELCGIIEKMMKVDLRSRYQNMAEVVRDLEARQAHMNNKDDMADLLRAALSEGSGEMNIDFNEPDDDDFRLVPKPPEPAREKPTLLCVEVQDQIQQALRRTLTDMGYRVFLIGDAERAAERYAESPTDAVIFDTDGLGQNSLDSFGEMHDKAHAEGRPLRAVVLLGPRQQILATRLPKDDRIEVLLKPIKMKQLQDAIQKVLPLR